MPSPANYSVSAAAITASGSTSLNFNYDGGNSRWGIDVYPASFGTNPTNTLNGDFSPSIPGGATVNGFIAGVYGGTGSTDPSGAGGSSDTWGFTSGQITSTLVNAGVILSYFVTNAPGGSSYNLTLGVNSVTKSKSISPQPDLGGAGNGGGFVYAYSMYLAIYYTTAAGATGTAVWRLFFDNP